MQNKRKYFNLKVSVANVLMMKFVEVIFANGNEKLVLKKIMTQVLSDKKLTGSQYLGG